VLLSDRKVAQGGSQHAPAGARSAFPVSNGQLSFQQLHQAARALLQLFQKWGPIDRTIKCQRGRCTCAMFLANHAATVSRHQSGADVSLPAEHAVPQIWIQTRQSSATV